MNTQADDWPKEPLNGVLIASVIFLSILPSLGWAWHSVLPEHTHVFVGIRHSDADEVLAAAPAPSDLGACLNCATPQLTPGLEHLPTNDGVQILGFAALGLILACFVPPAYEERLVLLPFLYRSPVQAPPDPPPNVAALPQAQEYLLAFPHTRAGRIGSRADSCAPFPAICVRLG